MGIEKETAGFCFGGRGGNSPNGFAEDMNSAIGDRIRGGTGGTRKGGKEKVTCGAAASVGKYKVGGVGADCKDHVAGVITDSGDRMC